MPFAPAGLFRNGFGQQLSCFLLPKLVLGGVELSTAPVGRAIGIDADPKDAPFLETLGELIERDDHPIRAANQHGDPAFDPFHGVETFGLHGRPI